MYQYVKRIFDILLSIALLIVLGIPMLIIAILIKLEDEGPAIFKQKRMGKDLKPFEIYKFRSMIVNRKELEGKLTHDQMTTKIGKFIRKTSLDELPQIFNVLKGEMSFIGPRPWVLDYYDWLTPAQKKRCNVLPGISGLAQVRGRNGISVHRKIEYDLEYINHFGLKYDIKILIETIKVILGKKDSEITENGINDEIGVLKNNPKGSKKNKNRAAV
ncbi:MAG: sugar transferase [Clostridia bacterium]|nr:sugar transferase [Clostridia bacterium]